MTPANLSLIWAQDSAGVIGINGYIPWSVPEDLSHFQRLTLDNCVVMGTKTYLSLPSGGLSHRINIVIGKTYAEHSWIINFRSAEGSVETVYGNPRESFLDILETHAIGYQRYAEFSVASHSKAFFSATLFFPDMLSWWRYQHCLQYLSCEIFIIGGENIYTALMPFAQRLYITDISYESRSGFSENEIQAIAYAPSILDDFVGNWEDWQQSSVGLYYRFGRYERQVAPQEMES